MPPTCFERPQADLVDADAAGSDEAQRVDVDRLDVGDTVGQPVMNARHRAPAAPSASPAGLVERPRRGRVALPVHVPQVLRQPAQVRVVCGRGVESTTGAVAVGGGGSCSRRLSPMPVPHSSPWFPASGSRTRSCLRPREARCARRKVREPVLGPEPVSREASQLPGPHLVLAAEPLAQPPGRVPVNRHVGRADLSQGEVVRPATGCLREGARSYVKGFALPVEPVRGQRYSPVRLMCSQPRGETWARNSAGIVSPALRLAKTASPSFSVFQ